MFNFLLMGAQGTGKSTLLDRLSSNKINGIGVNSIKSISREYIASNGLSTGYETSYTDLFAYYALFLSSFNKSQSSQKINVFDRSILDPLIFARMKFAQKDYVCILGEEIFCALTKSIHGIIYVPIEFAIFDDGFRSLESTKQQRFDKELRGLILDWKLNHVTVLGTVEQRLEIIERFIEAQITKQSHD